MNDYRIIDLPDDALPDISELQGDLRLLAETLTAHLAALLPEGLRPLAPALGVRLALRVAQVFGGTVIRIGGWLKWILRYRDRCIRRDYDRGMTAVELGRKYGLSDRQVYNITGVAEPETRQMSLWG